MTSGMSGIGQDWHVIGHEWYWAGLAQGSGSRWGVEAQGCSPHMHADTAPVGPPLTCMPALPPRAAARHATGSPQKTSPWVKVQVRVRQICIVVRVTIWVG